MNGFIRYQGRSLNSRTAWNYTHYYATVIRMFIYYNIGPVLTVYPKVF